MIIFCVCAFFVFKSIELNLMISSNQKEEHKAYLCFKVIVSKELKVKQKDKLMREYYNWYLNSNSLMLNLMLNLSNPT